MVRWRACLVLAVLLLLPRTGGKTDEEEDDELKQRDTVDESDEEDEDDDDEEGEEPEKREPPGMPGRRAFIPPPRVAPSANAARARQRPPQPRGAKNLPFDCYTCSYKNAAPQRSCLDPVKFRVHSVTCHNLGDKCFTTVTSKNKSYEEIERGCRTGCIDTANTKCCEANRCNNQAFAVPMVPETLVRPLVENNKATKSPPPSVLFFVTILLLLQTVVKAKLRIRKNKTSAVPKPETLVDEPDEDDDDKATKSPPPSVLFFVTILLLLQTVVKVSFV